MGLASLRNRIALIVFCIALGSIAVVYVGIVPTLERSLRDQALRGLLASTRRYAGPIERAVNRSEDQRRIDERVRDAADDATVRATLLGVSRSGVGGIGTFLKSDSTREVEISDLSFPMARDAARTGRPAVGTEAGDDGRIGEAALPLFSRDPDTGERVVGSVLVFSTPLSGVADAESVIRRRILWTGALALLTAAIAGWIVAQALSLRIRRLDHVAGKVAAGDMGTRFPIGPDDELGRLAHTLETMRRQLSELDAARKRFIATASHELRTPLFSLGGFLELLEDEEVPEEDRRMFVAQLRSQVVRLQRLATDLLDLSRLEAGSVELRAEPTDLRAVARQVADEFIPGLAAHESRLELRLPAQPVVAVCDPERVAQILRILVDNALAHTPAGTDLVISAAPREPGTPGRPVRIGVGDFGPGISRALQTRIFEPFVTTDDAQGSGLGLAIAHELSERMRGKLEVASQPGRTTFTLELPD